MLVDGTVIIILSVFAMNIPIYLLLGKNVQATKDQQKQIDSIDEKQNAIRKDILSFDCPLCEEAIRKQQH